MQFISTRSADVTVGIDDAILQGLARDGGLFMPTKYTRVDLDQFKNNQELGEFACQLLKPFFDKSQLRSELAAICTEAFSFKIPLRNLEKNLYSLELFHGPTSAFKDVGARFLAACMARLNTLANHDKPLTILVATSGDTGGAVASAFHQKTGVKVAVLFPKGQVSARQQQQLTCWGDNIHSFCIEGSFDDCQRLVKTALLDTDLSTNMRLSSANSISIARLLPQMVYYAQSSLSHFRQNSQPLNFVIPSGNLGNSFACLLARELGFPIGNVVLATNQNRVVPDFLSTGVFQPQPSIHTLASAMDVGNPSNLERIRKLFPENRELNRKLSAQWVSDGCIEQAIKDAHRQWELVICPHTATALHVYSKMSAEEKNRDWALVATADAAKFETVVEPLIGEPIALPNQLSKLLKREQIFSSLSSRFADFKQTLLA